MTINPHRAQLVAFSRPYYIEGAALLTSVKSKYKTYEELLKAGSDVTASVLQNVDAELLVHTALPEAKPMLLDTQANVIQALESGRSDTAVVDLSTVRWLAARNPDRYVDAGHAYYPMLYGAAVTQGDPDWLKYVDTVFNVSMFGHLFQQYAEPFEKYFGQTPPTPTPGFPGM
jgi:polar amino acid transport system substrate-binding protein